MLWLLTQNLLQAWRFLGRFAPDLICCFLTKIAWLIIHNAEIECHFIHWEKAEERTKGWDPAVDESYNFLPLLTSNRAHQPHVREAAVLLFLPTGCFYFRSVRFPGSSLGCHEKGQWRTQHGLLDPNKGYKS